MKAESVWCDWTEDTPKILQMCMLDDLKYWKLDKIAKQYKER